MGGARRLAAGSRHVLSFKAFGGKREIRHSDLTVGGRRSSQSGHILGPTGLKCEGGVSER